MLKYPIEDFVFLALVEAKFQMIDTLNVFLFLKNARVLKSKINVEVDPQQDMSA